MKSESSSGKPKEKFASVLCGIPDSVGRIGEEETFLPEALKNHLKRKKKAQLFTLIKFNRFDSV